MLIPFYAWLGCPDLMQLFIDRMAHGLEFLDLWFILNNAVTKQSQLVCCLSTDTTDFTVCHSISGDGLEVVSVS